MNKNYSIVIALMMFFNFSLFSQDSPPWDFNGTDHGFVASNYTTLAVGDSYLTYSINSPNEDGNGGSSNPNLKISNVEIDTSPGTYFAVTMQNLTANTKVVVIINKNGNNTYTPFDGISPNDEGFVTHYINVGGSANWNGTVNEVNFRFKQGGGVNNNVYSGDILIDHIEIVDAIPSTPRTDYTFDDPSDAEGFIGGNGVSLSQPNAGSIVANISANSPYPKFEQTGVYSVDADAYKYVEINLTNNSPKNRVTFVSPNGGNQFAGSDMVPGEQLIYLNLSEMTNWNGTYANWWLQLVESAGEGAPLPSAGEVIIDRILFTNENNAPPAMHDVTFNVDARNIIVHDKGMYMGGGILGGADAVAMSDEDGDGIWSVTLSLEEGTTGNWAFFNSPGDGGDWGTKENLEGQPCADAANYNDRVVPAFDADNLEFNFCFAVCNDTNSFCAETVERANVTFTVGTADIEVGANGMFVGGGAFGGSNGHAMADNGDDTHSVTISVPVGLTGHYAFFNSPGTHYDWGTKEQLGGLECGDSSNYDDRPLAEVTGDTSISFCFGTCETECTTTEPEGCEFSIVLTDAYGDGWNGNSLDVLVNGEVVLDDIATQIEDDLNPVTFTFAVATGDVIDVTYDDSGTWDGENAYVVYNNQGEIIAAESGAGGGSADPGPADTIGLAGICAEDLSNLGKNSFDMVIYPNPVDGDYVTIQTPLNGDKLVEVFDVNGRKVMERLLTTDTLNVSSISAGMYIVKVTVEDQSNVSKLIIE
ncbi:MAG: hypothetical protein CM15mP121_2080 [Bacteroidota bacterium]|nr:MAG: hypothetical protein CM15mP121_2080 [Bacteroidota bacterium]